MHKIMIEKYKMSMKTFIDNSTVSMHNKKLIEVRQYIWQSVL